MRSLLAVPVVLTLGAAPTAIEAQIVQDGGFETPVLASNNQYQYSGFAPGPPTSPTGPLASPWTFVQNSGLVRGSGSTFNTPAPFPGGQQVAFLQGTGTAVQQSVTIPAAGSYLLSFSRAGRNATGAFDGNTTYNVFFGGNLVGTGATTSGSAWLAQSIPLSAGAGSAILRFENTSLPGDHTFFLDAVAITQAPTQAVVPEPGTVSLLAVGFAALAGSTATRRRRHA